MKNKADRKEVEPDRKEVEPDRQDYESRETPDDFWVTLFVLVAVVAIAVLALLVSI